MEAILIISIILTIVLIVQRVYNNRRKEAIRYWCILLYFQKEDYSTVEIEKMAEFLISLSHKELRYYKEILPLTNCLNPNSIKKEVKFITKGITFSKPPE